MFLVRLFIPMAFGSSSHDDHIVEEQPLADDVLA
jgi:hypothetical protein